MESTGPLGVGDEAQVAFAGLADGKVVGEIKSPGKDNQLQGQFTRVIEPVDGYYPLPEGPGLGIDIVEEELTSRPYSNSWHRGDRVNPDNSIAFI